MLLLLISTCENDDSKTYLKKLYMCYYPIMKKKANSIVGHPEVVDDLIQEAFIKLIPKISLLRSMNCYKTTSYIVNTIKHVCIDYVRKDIQRSQNTYSGLDNDLAEQIPDLQATTEENYMKSEDYDALERAMLVLLSLYLSFPYYI